MKRRTLAASILLLTSASAWSEPQEPAFKPQDGPAVKLPKPVGIPRNRLSNRNINIVGGAEVGNADYMAVVGMVYSYPGNRNDLPQCTGVLIGPELVLTAAHCVCGSFVPTHIYVGRNPAGGKVDGHGYYEIRNGALRTASGCTPGGGQNLKAGLDLALAKIIEPAIGIRTYSIAPPALIDGAQSFRIVGFGATDTRAQVAPRRKMRAAVQPLSKDCTARPGGVDPSAFGCQQGEEIVAKGQGVTDTCAGDSGGPLLVATSPEGTTVQVAGITSRGIEKSPLKCGSGGIYERMTPTAVRWIAAATEDLSRY